MSIVRIVFQLKSADILSHFSAFGVMKSVRIRNKPTRLYGFVAFTEPKSAAKALEIEMHTIAGCRVEVSIAYRQHQHRTDLLNLNDDCIIEILECLSMLDLCSIADTSCRLREIAKRVFRRNEKDWDIIGDFRRGEVKQAERVFVNFGSMMARLTFCYSKWKEFLDYVTKYCGKALKSVDFYMCFIPDDLTTKLRPIFKNLQELSLKKCHFAGDKTLFGDCESLVKLIIHQHDPVKLIYKNTFPKLEILRFVPCDESDDDSFDDESDDEEDWTFDPFLLRHKNLKELSILECNITPSVIVDNFKRLEHFEFTIPADTTFDLSNFNHLKMLSIDCNNRKVNECTQPV